MQKLTELMGGLPEVNLPKKGKGKGNRIEVIEDGNIPTSLKFEVSEANSYRDHRMYMCVPLTFDDFNLHRSVKLQTSTRPSTLTRRYSRRA